MDDIVLIRALLLRHLKALGRKIVREGPGCGDLELLEACDGQAALEVITSRHVDLIFLDLMMPIMDGFTFLEKKRNVTRLESIPVIVCSALGEPEKLQRATDLGALDYIVKPFKLSAVERSFRKLLCGVP